MDVWAYAVVSNSPKRATGGGKQAAGNLGTPIFVNQGGKRSYECGTAVIGPLSLVI